MPFLCRCCHASHFILFAFIHFRKGTRENDQNKKKKRRKLNSDNLLNGNEGATSSSVMPTTVTPTSSFEQKGALQQVGSVDDFTPSSSFEEKGSQSDRKFMGVFPIYLSHRMLSNHLCCFAMLIIKDFSTEDVTDSSEYENETGPSSQPTEYLDNLLSKNEDCSCKEASCIECFSRASKYLKYMSTASEFSSLNFDVIYV